LQQLHFKVITLGLAPNEISSKKYCIAFDKWVNMLWQNRQCVFKMNKNVFSKKSTFSSGLSHQQQTAVIIHVFGGLEQDQIKQM